MNLSTVQALVFIIKAFISTFLFLVGKIKKEQFEARLEEMQKLINQATTGPLDERVQAGQEIENRINRHEKNS